MSRSIARPIRKKLRRDNVVTIRVTDSEYTKIDRLSFEDGLTRSSWCRELILDYLRQFDDDKKEKK